MIARAAFRRAPQAHAPWLVMALDQILAWIERSKQRADLAGLEPDALLDLGLSSADVDAECRKHFWQP